MIKLIQILEEVEENKINMIYVDMDSVLTNFDAAFQEVEGNDEHLLPKEFIAKYSEKKFWELINNAGVPYWSEMKWQPGGKTLLRYIWNKNIPMELLSTPSAEMSSKVGKKLWVKTRLNNQIKLNLSFNKKIFAGPDKILIDDNADNIYEWRLEGGIGILHENINLTLDQLKKLGI